MCGLTGMFSLGGSLESGYIDLMTHVLEHRGPDATGYFKDEHIHLGSTRLSIMDVAHGSQPMFNEDQSIVTVMNGEIYNFKSLRKELTMKGHKFRTKSDTEVLVHLYEEFGCDLVHKIKGQFAFIIYDKQKHDVFIARDRFGICPLYYAIINEVLYVSSEIKAFAQLDWFNGNPDILGLVQSLQYWTTISTRTVFEQVKSLPKAHFLVIKRPNQLHLERYHALRDYQEDLKITSIDALKEMMRYNIKEAVKKRLVTDASVKVGAYVSGGLDSTIIARLVDDIGVQDFTTFSLTFQDTPYDESRYQKESIKGLDCHHIQLDVTNKQIVDTLPKVLHHTEVPLYKTGPIPMYLLSKEVHTNKRKVILSGEGADEIFYGYDVFKETLIRRLWANHHKSNYRSGLFRQLYYEKVNNETAYQYLSQFYEGTLDDPHHPLYPIVPQLQYGASLVNYFADEHKAFIYRHQSHDVLHAAFDESFWSLPLMKRCQGLQMELLLNGYLLSSQGDRMLSAHAIEGRYPFLDENVVQMAYNIPDALKLSGFKEKYILKEAYSGGVPEAILNRKKFPYTAPHVNVFFDNSLDNGYIQELLSKEAIEQLGIFHYEQLKPLIDKYSGNTNPMYFSTREHVIMTYVISTQLLFKMAKNKFSYTL